MFGTLSELTSGLDWLREDLEPSYVPALNVWEEGELVRVEAEVPGLKLEDVEVAFNNGELTLKGEKKFEHKENAPLHRRERLYGAFSRTLSLPWEIDAGKVSAELKDGVLTITLPKAEAAKPRKIEVRYVDRK